MSGTRHFDIALARFTSYSRAIEHFIRRLKAFLLKALNSNYLRELGLLAVKLLDR